MVNSTLSTLLNLFIYILILLLTRAFEIFVLSQRDRILQPPPDSCWIKTYNPFAMRVECKFHKYGKSKKSQKINFVKDFSACNPYTTPTSFGWPPIYNLWRPLYRIISGILSASILFFFIYDSSKINIKLDMLYFFIAIIIINILFSKWAYAFSDEVFLNIDHRLLNEETEKELYKSAGAKLTVGKYVGRIHNFRDFFELGPKDFKYWTMDPKFHTFRWRIRLFLYDILFTLPAIYYTLKYFTSK